MEEAFTDTQGIATEGNIVETIRYSHDNIVLAIN